MPGVPTSYAHVAVTDHRIARHPGVRVQAKAARTDTLAAWVEPPSEFRRRNLVIANLLAANRLAHSSLRKNGMSMFESFEKSAREIDSNVLSAACQAMLEQEMFKRGVDVCRLAMQKQPGSAERAMNLGIALSRSGDFAGAEAQFKTAIRLDASLKHAYIELWTLYDVQKETRKMAETGDLFLRWNPQNIMFRVLKRELAGDTPVLLNDSKQ